MRDAMSAFDQVLAFSGDQVRDQDVIMLLGLVEPSVLGDTVRAIAGNDSDGILRVVSDLVDGGTGSYGIFAGGCSAQFRNLMVLKAGVTDLQVLGVPESLVPDLRKQAELLSTEDLLRIFDALLKTEDDLKDSTNTRFQLEMGLLELAQLPRVRSLETLIAEFSALVKGNLPGPGGTATTPEPRALRSRGRIFTSRPASQKGPERQFRRHSNSVREPSGPTLSAVKEFSPQDLLQRIAAAVQKESIGSALRALPGAELKDDLLVLDLTPVNEFFRRQIKENSSAITQAASQVAGRPITISFLQGPRNSGKGCRRGGASGRRCIGTGPARTHSAGFPG